MFILVILTILILQTTLSQNLLVGLQYPALLDSNKTNIKTMGIDKKKNFLVGLDNSQAKKYDPTFTTSTTFSLPDSPESIQSFNIVAGNTTTVITNATSIVTISNQRRTIRSYADSNYQL